MASQARQPLSTGTKNQHTAIITAISTTSPDMILKKLPEELLVHVLSELPPSAFHLASMSCKALRRISQTARFDHVPVPRAKISTEKPAMTSREEWKLKQYLRPFLYCSDCLPAHDHSDFAKRREELQEMVHRSKCDMSHPAVFFSAKQRQLLPFQRMCIGWEGRLTFCSHGVSLAWEDVDRLQTTTKNSHSSNEWSPSQTTFHRSCSDDSHRAFATQHNYFKKMNGRASVKFDALEEIPTVFVEWHDEIELPDFANQEQEITPVPILSQGSELVARNKELARIIEAGSRTNAIPCPHQTWAEWSGNPACSVCKWKVHLDYVKILDQRLYLNRSIRFKHPSEYGWITSLDPVSWGMAEDNETRNIIWCPRGSDCATIRGWKLFKPCPF